MIPRPSDRLGRSALRPMAEINVTPLVDVMLVLLAIFMVTAPMLVASIKVDPPRAAAAQNTAARDPVVVSIRRDGAMAVGREQVSLGELAGRVGAAAHGAQDTAILINADKATPHGAVVAAMDQLVRAGFGHLAIVANPDAGTRR